MDEILLNFSSFSGPNQHAGGDNNAFEAADRKVEGLQGAGRSSEGGA